jgi:hypothetical protein
MAHVSERNIAFCWNNFTHRPANTAEERERNPFWHYIPDMFSELEDLLDGQKWKSPVLNQLVLHDLWDRYRIDPEYRWLHLRIRAERYGVALSAYDELAFDIEAIMLDAVEVF